MKFLLNQYINKLMEMFTDDQSEPPILSPLGQQLKEHLRQRVEQMFETVQNSEMTDKQSQSILKLVKAPLRHILTSFNENTIIAIVGFVTNVAKELQEIIRDFKRREASAQIAAPKQTENESR